MSDEIYPYTFTAPIEKFGVGKTRKVWYNVLFLPQELRDELPFGKYPRLRVEGEIAEFPIQNAFIPAGNGRNYVIVSPGVMKAADLGLGDVVAMRFVIADQDFVDVPEALEFAIGLDKDRELHWENLTPGKKRMLAQHVRSAKTDDTRQKRVEEAMAALVGFAGDINAWRKASR
ncbi:MAG: YdeI/OmpD-associated family protein [Pseudomonadota bacterium]